MKSSTFLLALSILVLGSAGAHAVKTSAPPKPKSGTAKPKAPLPVTLEILTGTGDALTPAKDGMSIAGETTFRVRVQSSEPVSSVEFTVGNDLRDTDGSTPYEFKLDALGEDEGVLTLTFKAYTSSGNSGTKVLKVKIDNGSSLGAEALLKRGNQALNEGRLDDAITSGRVVLKLDSKSVAGNLLLARAYLRKGTFDRAQKYAEDAGSADPANLDAPEVLAQVGVQRAFTIVSKPGADRSEAQKAIKESLIGAVDARQKAANARYEKATKGGDLAATADAAFAAGRYSAAVAALDGPFRKDATQTALGNRLAYAHLMMGDRTRANEIVSLERKFGKPDAYTYALQGILAVESASDPVAADKAADEAFKNGLLENPDSFGVRTAQASVALKRDRVRDLRNLAVGLGKDANSRPEANFFLSAVTNRLSDYGVARKQFEEAVRVDPANADVYVEQGNQAVGIAVGRQVTDPKEKEAYLASAQTMYEVALDARPGSAPALVGLSLVANLQKRADDAVRFADAATKADPNSAAAEYALAGALALRQKAIAAALANPAATNRPQLLTYQKSNFDATQAAMKSGAAKDPAVRNMPVPTGADVYRFFIGTGRTPLISPPSAG